MSHITIIARKRVLNGTFAAAMNPHSRIRPAACANCKHKRDRVGSYGMRFHMHCSVHDREVNPRFVCICHQRAPGTAFIPK